MRVGCEETGTSRGKALSSRGTAPLKPKEGLSGPPANPQTWNRYAYVGNNPLALVDFLGEDYGYIDNTVYGWENLLADGGGDGADPGWDPVETIKVVVNGNDPAQDTTTTTYNPPDDVVEMPDYTNPSPNSTSDSGGGGGSGASAANVGVIRRMTFLECTSARAEDKSLATQANISDKTVLGKLANMALGNTFSGMYEFAQTVRTATNAAPVYMGLVLNGVRQGLPGGGKIGQGVLGTAQDALVKAAAQNLGKEGAQLAAETVGDIKIGYDLATFVYSGVQCIF